MDLSADDFSLQPWTYPGTAAPHGGLLHDGVFRPLEPGRGQIGDEAGVAAASERHLVVAVGSNASPAVMTHKLEDAQVDTTVPFVAVTVRGLAVGHSAHVSVRGYLAAAPFYDPSATTRLVATLLDEAQLACLDRTEPNYVRRSVHEQTCPLEVDGGQRMPAFTVYVSRWGLLGPPGGRPWPVTPQEQLFPRLVRECAGFAALVERFPDARSAMTALAADPGLRLDVRQMLQADDWSRLSELDTGQSAG